MATFLIHVFQWIILSETAFRPHGLLGVAGLATILISQQAKELRLSFLYNSLSRPSLCRLLLVVIERLLLREEPSMLKGVCDRRFFAQNWDFLAFARCRLKRVELA